MTKLLEKAIAKIRELPEEEQNSMAATLLSMAEEAPIELDAATRAAIQKGIRQARNGQYVPDKEIDQLWERYDV